ncbi:prephenate dehydratase [Desulfogranum japonicum]|uniref:prephenate dehydratase n=1 Tax=Desulfogranum japonicum TaxID=231447 RepID=UPI00040FA45E|nr:prephenate dehydratase [Desulfogranum japonicum]
METPKTIPEVRDRIDTIDDTILELLKERLSCAKMIGQLKNETNRAKWDPQRELEIYQRLREKNQDFFPHKALYSIFHEIITTCRLSQRKTSVAYLGPEATFTHQAGVKYFGQTAKYQPFESIIEIFQEVDKERVDYGIVPVENSIEGAVTSCLDSFLNYNVQICGEIQLPISHNLVCRSGNMEDIKTVASHAQPLAQCREWLRKNMPDIPTLPVFSTGAAAQMAANNPNVGAIASSLSATTYNLQVVVKGIEDYQGNTTRFLVLGRKSPQKSGADKTSILVGLINRPGALNEILTILSAKNIDLAKIESRPTKGKLWKYLFFIDMVGHMEDPVISEACTILQQICAYYEWLGSYPRSGEMESKGTDR